MRPRTEQLASLLRAGARIMLVPPGQDGIDLTPEMLAFFDGGKPGNQCSGPAAGSNLLPFPAPGESGPSQDSNP